MEIRNHAANSRDAARHIVKKIELVAIVDAHVRVCRPDQHCIDSPKPLIQIVEIAVDRVSARRRIEEIPVLYHQLRLHEAALRPLQLRTVVLTAVIADALPLFIAPASHACDPGRKIGGPGGPIYYLAIHMDRRVLRRQAARSPKNCAERYRRANPACFHSDHSERQSLMFANCTQKDNRSANCRTRPVDALLITPKLGLLSVELGALRLPLLNALKA